jgi:hypothetical protein
MFMFCSDMQGALLIDATPAPDRAARDDAMTDRQLAILGRLAEAGLEIAVALEAQAKGGEVVVQGDVAMAYNRVARAVRQTIMLQSRLIEARRDRLDIQAGRKTAAGASAARILRGLIEDEGPDDAERAERLTTEAAERLRAEDFGDLLSRPFGEAVAAIARDLGLSPDWLRLAEDCYAAEMALSGEARAGAAEPAYGGPIEVQWSNEEPDRLRDSS